MNRISTCSGKTLLQGCVLSAALALNACSQIGSTPPAYPYPADQQVLNRVADAIRIAKIRTEQLNLSGGGDCVPGRIYRLQQLIDRAQREHLSGLNQDALHTLRILDQKINDTEHGLRYLQTRTTCLERKPNPVLTAIQPLLNEIERVNFASDSASLPEKMEKPLLDLARWLNQHPVYRLTIIGHTDTQGTDEANEVLALNRARTLRTFLLNEGVSGYQVRADGHGEHNPVSNNLDDNSRSKNRRIRLSMDYLLESESRSQRIKNWPPFSDIWGGN